ncbi:TPA: HutD family protein [Providencia stuartii]|uniref:HutD family protein n=4 Tax=Gammaproteobacteria TaxID=1236 RepID=A0AAJ1JGB9_PROST|nr:MULTISPECIES: HutD family protein [Providencia]SST03085.1 Various environmental stresses-induced protein [Acinetobacter baumannii]AFH95773.1 hypothetical protein S70_19900 [Providencia stuartii MRSN 2154]AIN65895.1 hutD family protein [Providencia stuartii]AMG66125.1 hypothetical protein AL507_05805 [Providencia stuartii]APG49774.1 hypothetical protein BGK56_01950 [Providencia stuartii]
MKIKCFDAAELPIEEWQDKCGNSAEVFCWPVASDFSLRVSITQINQSSVLKQHAESEQFCISLDNGQLSIRDQQKTKHSMAKIGDAFHSEGEQLIELELRGSPVRLLNVSVNPERWRVKSHVIAQEQRLPIGQAGIVYVLAGEWDVSGANCKIMAVNQGGWWLPDIGEGHITPRVAGSKLIWVDITAC